MEWYFWLLIAFGIILAYYVGRRNLFPIPFVDNRVTMVVTTDDPQIWLSRINALAVGGVRPVMMTLGDDLLRAFYRDGFILNCARQEQLEKMGRPNTALVLTRRHPDHEANRIGKNSFAGNFKMWEPDPDLRPAYVCLITSPLLGGLMIGCRRHALRMGGPPSRWHQTEAEAAASRW